METIILTFISNPITEIDFFQIAIIIMVIFYLLWYRFLLNNQVQSIAQNHQNEISASLLTEEAGVSEYVKATEARQRIYEREPQDLNRLSKLLEDRSRELHLANYKMNQVASFLSHELRSSSSTILGLLNIYDKLSTIEEREEINKQIYSFTKKLNSTLSRASESLVDEDCFEETDLNKVIYAACRRFNDVDEIQFNLQVQQVHSCPNLLTDALQDLLILFKSDRAVNTIEIVTSETDNFWTLELNRCNLHDIVPTHQEFTTSLQNKSQLIVDKLHGRIAFYYDTDHIVQHVKVTFPKVSKKLVK